MRRIRTTLLATLSMVLAFVPALAASQGLLHDHDGAGDDLDRRVVQMLLADLDPSTDGSTRDFLRTHFVLDGDEETAHPPGGEGFCCAGVGAACGVALLQEVSLRLAHGDGGFGCDPLARAESAHISAITPPPRSL